MVGTNPTVLRSAKALFLHARSSASVRKIGMDEGGSSSVAVVDEYFLPIFCAIGMSLGPDIRPSRNDFETVQGTKASIF